MGHSIVGYLISLAVGYWLLTLAEKENGLVKTLGRVLAGIVIVVSLLGPICKVAMGVARHSMGGGYAMGHHGWGRGSWGHEGMGQDGSCCMGMEKDGKGGMMGMGHMHGKDGMKDKPAEEPADSK